MFNAYSSCVILLLVMNAGLYKIVKQILYYSYIYLIYLIDSRWFEKHKMIWWRIIDFIEIFLLLGPYMRTVKFSQSACTYLILCTFCCQTMHIELLQNVRGEWEGEKRGNISRCVNIKLLQYVLRMLLWLEQNDVQLIRPVCLERNDLSNS